MQFHKESLIFVAITEEGLPRISSAELVGLVCPVCKSRLNYQVRYPTDIWQWGLQGALENRSGSASFEERVVSIIGLNRDGLIICDSCKTPSGLTDDSVRRLASFFRKSLSGMPFDGPGWAMDPFRNFMIRHLNGDYNYRYSVREPEGHAPGSVYFAWLLDYCPCERCTKVRNGRPPRKEPLDLEQFLEPSPSAGG